MKRILRIATLAGLVLALSLMSVAVAGAQEGDPIEACSGDSISGTVVAVDEDSGEVTLELGDESLCTVQLSADFEHPVTSLLGTYFAETSADDLADQLDALMVSLSCTEGDSCTLADKGEDTVEGTIVSVTPLGDGEYEVVVEYLDDEGNPTTTSIVIESAEQAEAWTGALESLVVEWNLNQQDDGTFVSDAGDDIAALHDDGMGFGVIVKLYSMAANAVEACETLDEGSPSDPDAVDPCSVNVDSLVEAFQSGTGLGQLFQEYGRPALLGVGHIRRSLDGEGNTPPEHACGYWKKQADLSPDHPCYDVQQEWQNRNGNENGRGKPPWAGNPGGPHSQDGD